MFDDSERREREVTVGGGVCKIHSGDKIRQG
jgi:hypothetical protein